MVTHQIPEVEVSNYMEESSKYEPKGLKFSKPIPDEKGLIVKRLKIINNQIEWLSKIKHTLERKLQEDFK
ncbi:MAG: hypothetical protein ACTSRK_16100 [Promethearchaeota archaeon]